MSSYLERLIENDLVSEAIYDALTTRDHRHARTGYTNIHCPMCVSQGKSADSKFRCGIKSDDGIIVRCFKCQFHTKFRMGELLSKKMGEFLIALNVPQRKVQQLVLWARMVKEMVGQRPDLQVKLNVAATPDYFPAIDLPSGARSLQDWGDCDEPDYLATVRYLLSRGDVAASATTYYWSPTMSKRLIIPCHQHDRLVGWTSRTIVDGVEPRYDKCIPSNFLFNTKFLTIPERKYVFIVEGVFDALVIDGVAALGATLNEKQIAWINQSGKQPVVIGDRDTSGAHLIDIAVKNHWAVATIYYRGNQWWDHDIKDCSEATRRYGKLYVVQSIVSNLTYQKTQIYERTRL